MVQTGELVVERARRVHELRVERHVLLGRELQLCTQAWHGITRRGMSDDGAQMARGGCKEKEKRDCDCNRDARVRPGKGPRCARCVKALRQRGVQALASTDRRAQAATATRPGAHAWVGVRSPH